MKLYLELDGGPRGEIHESVRLICIPEEGPQLHVLANHEGIAFDAVEDGIVVGETWIEPGDYAEELADAGPCDEEG